MIELKLFVAFQQIPNRGNVGVCVDARNDGVAVLANDNSGATE